MSNGLNYRNGIARIVFVLAVAIVLFMVSGPAFTAVTNNPEPNGGSGNCPLGTTSTDQKCNICMSVTQAFASANLGFQMIKEIFNVINQILNRIETTFYQGIIGNPLFQKIIGAAFLMYIMFYGVMITFNLASYRSGEVANRLIKLAIVYAITGPAGWTFFSNWIQTPVLKGIDNIIEDIASGGFSGSGGASGSGGTCMGGLGVSGMSFSGTSGIPINISGTNTIQLNTGPMAMLFGPMTCAFAAKFIAGILAMLTTGFYGWLLALFLCWGLIDFAFMLVGAIFTYIKAVVGLVFLFGVAPIFLIFYLFEKTRALTFGWVSSVLGFALQPIMLFTFLAFYAAIIGSVLTTIYNNTTSGSGSGEDICYVPWFTMPGLFNIYWWRFTNPCSQAAGGQWINGQCSGGSGAVSGLGFGDPLPPPYLVLNILYFLVLCQLGKNFTNDIQSITMNITGGQGGGIVQGKEIGSWFKNNMMGGRTPFRIGATAFNQVKKSVGSLWGAGTRGFTRPPTNT